MNMNILCARFWFLFVAIVVSVGACGSSADPVAEPAKVDVSTRPPADARFQDTVGEFCNGGGDSVIEMAFRGTVVAIDESADQPWMTFAVSEWFTDDIGVEVGLWSPGFDVDVGGEFLIVSSRYTVGDRTSGDVYWCASETFTDDVYAKWLDDYNGSVIAGARTTEREADPEVVEEIEAFAALWADTEPDSYTYTIAMGEMASFDDECSHIPVRVVIEEGVVVQAADLEGRCDVTVENAPAVADLFDLARVAAGALEGPIVFNEEFGYIEGLSAYDRSVAAWGHVEAFEVGASRLSLDFDADLVAAQLLWQEAGISSYDWILDARCFCGFETPFEMKVRNGESVGGPGGLDRPRVFTVEDLFAEIERNADADRISVAYHPEFGYPTEVRIDEDYDISDDEIDYFVIALEPVT